MAQASSTRTPRITLPYYSLRSVTSPEDQEQDRRRYCGVTRANNIFTIDTSENVREFLGRTPEGEKRKTTLVNKAIRDTLLNNRDDFSLLNSGVVIVAAEAEVDDAKKLVHLEQPSIINGAQTKGVLQEFFADGDTDFPSLSFELIVTPEDDLAADISIARNFQNRVDDISIYGKLGRFDDLERVMRKAIPGAVLRKRETDVGETFLDTEKLVQVITALAPESVAFPSANGRVSKVETKYRTYAYRHRSRCLKDFAVVMDEENRAQYRDGYDYYLTVAPTAWQLYQSLKGEQYFSTLQKVKGVTVAGRKEVDPDGVPDGIVFPMLSALSRFVDSHRGRYAFKIPSRFPWRALFAQAEMLFKTTAKHNPQTMGKDTDCYVALHGVIDMYFAATSEM